MLLHTFIHLPGISEKRERALWRQGIWTWKQLELVLPQLRAIAQRASSRTCVVRPKKS